MKMPGLKILLVEDNPGDARLILEMLNEYGGCSYKIKTAGVLSAAFEELENPEFDIILLDLNLPDSAGLNTLERIVQETGKVIPVIVLTGLNDEDTGISAIEYGAADYLIKGELNHSMLIKSIMYSIGRKKSELEIREREERFRNLHESMIDAFVQVDMRGKIVSCNSTYLKMLGYSFEELERLTYIDLTPEKWRAGEAGIVEDQILKNGYSEIYEKEYRRKDGTIVPVELRTSLLRDPDGRSVGMWAIVRDITDRKKAEDSLKESEEIYRTFINASEDIVFLKDDQLRYILTNKKNAEVIGKPAEEITGRTDFELMPQETALQCAASDRLALIKNGPIISEETLDGKIYETRKFPVKLRDNRTGVGCFIRDVTDIRSAAKSIETAAQEWRTSFDSIEEVIWLLDTDLRILRANVSSEKLFGLSPAELIGKHCWSAVNGVGEPVENHPASRVKQSLSTETSVMKIKNLWLNITASPVIENGVLKGIVHIIKDITEQKLNEDLLLLRSAAIENAANAVVITDINGTILWANPAFEILTLYPLSDAVGHNSRDILKSGFHDREFYKDIWDTVLSGSIWKGEIINKKRDGTFYTEEMTIAPVKNTDGIIQNFIAIKQDITERKLAFDLLNLRLELINYSANHSPEELLVKTLDEVERITGSTVSFFHFLEEDQATLSLQAWSTATSQRFCRAEGGGRHYNVADAGVWVDCIRERKPVVHNDYMSLSHRRGLPEGHADVIREMVIPVKRNNIIKAILGVGNKSKDYNERDISVVIYLADIVWGIIEKKRGDEKLREFNAELELKVEERTSQLNKLNRELESFSFSVSHDLRAPVRHIMGFIDMLNREKGNLTGEKAEHYIDVIDDSARRMNQLIDDLLSYSRMTRTAFSRQNINLEHLVNEILVEYTSEIEQRNISIAINPLPEVTGDRAMMRIVFVNLISNAVKYTGKTVNPSMEIGCKLIDDKNTFYVKDNGVGFDMNYAGKLFGVFQRLHSDKDFSGTGIGLAMVRSIIERHNGRVWAESGEGKGACFYFTIPVEEKK